MTFMADKIENLCFVIGSLTSDNGLSRLDGVGAKATG